jgi:hypothetical protein
MQALQQKQQAVVGGGRGSSSLNRAARLQVRAAAVTIPDGFTKVRERTA